MQICMQIDALKVRARGAVAHAQSSSDRGSDETRWWERSPQTARWHTRKRRRGNYRCYHTAGVARGMAVRLRLVLRLRQPRASSSMYVGRICVPPMANEWRHGRVVPVGMRLPPRGAARVTVRSGGTQMRAARGVSCGVGCSARNGWRPASGQKPGLKAQGMQGLPLCIRASVLAARAHDHVTP